MTKVMPPLVPVRIWQEIPYLHLLYLINTEDKYYLENITESWTTEEYSFITIDYSNFRACAYSKRLTL